MKQWLISNPDLINRVATLEAKLADKLALNRDRGINAHANYEDCSTHQTRKDLARVWDVIRLNSEQYDYPDDYQPEKGN